MNPTLQKLILSQQPIIPRNIKPNVLAWWDASKRGDVVYPLPQLVANGDFTNGATGWGLGLGWSIVDGAAVSSGGAGTYLSHADVFSNTTNKHYIAFNVPAYTSGGVSLLPAHFDQQVIFSGTGKKSTILIPKTSYFYLYQEIYIGSVDDVMIIDLTAIFGAGNEPTSAEMDAILAADGTPYWEGTRNVKCNPGGKYYWYDYSGHGRHMKLNGFAYSGVSGWQVNPASLGTDGVDDYAAYAETEINPVNSSYSTATIFKIPNITGVKIIALGDLGATSGGCEIYVSNANLTAAITDSVSGSASKNTTIVADKFYFAVASYNQDTKKVKLYLNGSYIGESAAITTGINQITKIKSGINTAETARSAVTIGLIVPINKALSDAEVNQIWNSNRRRFGL